MSELPTYRFTSSDENLGPSKGIFVGRDGEFSKQHRDSVDRRSARLPVWPGLAGEHFVTTQETLVLKLEHVTVTSQLCHRNHPACNQCGNICYYICLYIKYSYNLYPLTSHIITLILAALVVNVFYFFQSEKRARTPGILADVEPMVD